MKSKSTGHKGYNENTPTHPRGSFPPDNANEKHPLSHGNKKQKPVVAEKKAKPRG
ncbi:MAG: hypothetical protein JST39_20240 [Bacteroidetes bacterium]|nr:hypothetical protein [Bacteroidota bacterium]